MKSLYWSACCVILSGASLEAQQLQPPYAVTVLNDHSPEERNSRQRVQRILRDRFEDQTTQATGVFSSLIESRSKTGFRFTKGRVYATAGKRVESCLFISIPDRKAFEAFVEADRLARGGVVQTVDGNSNWLRLTSSPTSTKTEGDVEVTMTYGDVCYRYIPGLMVTGGEEVFHIDFAPVIDRLDDAQDQSAYWYIKPAYASESFRRSYFDWYARSWQVRQQRRDNESLEEYSLRHDLYDLYLKILEGVVRDVDTLVLKHRLPDASQRAACKVQVQVNLKPRSELAKFLAHLPNSPPSIPVATPNSLATGSVSLRLPPDLQALATQAIEQSSEPNTLFTSAILDTIRKGRIYLGGNIELDMTGSPIINFSATLNSDSVRTEDVLAHLTSPSPPAQNPAQMILEWINSNSTNQNFNLTGCFDDQQLIRLRIDDGTSPKPEQARPIHEAHAPARMRNRVLELKLDCQKLFASQGNSISRQLLTSLESAYFEQNVNGYQSRNRQLAGSLIKIDFQPLISKASANTGEDWTLRLTLDVSRDGSSVQFEMTVGQELSDLWRAQQHLYDRAIRKRLGF